MMEAIERSNDWSHAYFILLIFFYKLLMLFVDGLSVGRIGCLGDGE